MHVGMLLAVFIALLHPAHAVAADEAKAADYAYCAGVAYVMASSASLNSLDPYIKAAEADELKAKAKIFSEMRKDFLSVARSYSDEAFVAREMPNVTRKLNALRLREVDLNNALLKADAEKCSTIWKDEVKSILKSQQVAHAPTMRSTSLPLVAGRCAINPRSAG